MTLLVLSPNLSRHGQRADHIDGRARGRSRRRRLGAMIVMNPMFVIDSGRISE
jgi:hypothetical protein